MLITDEYRAMQAQFHLDRPDYGMSSQKHVESILQLSQSLGTRDILDYGCGKCALQKGLPFPIQNYDPCIQEFARTPTPAELVVCTDVLEHIEPTLLKNVLDDMRRLTLKLCFIEVACRPAKKILPDGRNAHLIQETPNWWLTWLLPRFELHSFQAQKGGFIALLSVPPMPSTAGGEDA